MKVNRQVWYYLEPKYESKLCRKMVKELLLNGKLLKAIGIMKSSINEALKILKIDVLELEEKLLNNIRCDIRLMSVRLGRQMYKLPHKIKEHRVDDMSIKRMVKCARSKRKNITKHLTQEIVNCYYGNSDTMKQVQDIKKLGHSNKAFVSGLI